MILLSEMLTCSLDSAGQEASADEGPNKDRPDLVIFSDIEPVLFSVGKLFFLLRKEHFICVEVIVLYTFLSLLFTISIFVTNSRFYSSVIGTQGRAV